MRHAYLIAIVLAFLVVFPTVSAACDVSDSFNYSYTNTGERTDRVTFVLLNKTSADMNIVFEPSVIIVIPDETKTFTVHASASDSLEGVQSAGFAIRAGTDIVAQATALFDLSNCPDGEENGSEPGDDRSANFALAVLGYSLLVLIVCLLILWGVIALLDSREDEPRERRVRESRTTDSDTERRAPINVDAMIRAEREHEDHTPWWLWLLIFLAVVVIIGALIYLLVSGSDMTGFNYGAGINITNLTNATNASA